MAELKLARLDQIRANPHRNLDTYPFIDTKLEHLQRSIDDVGFWEGVIARPAGDGYEIAFGHHRVEAAKRAGLMQIPLIVRDELTDDDMLKFMGRENGEDYRSDFLIMLETWDAAMQHLDPTGSKIDNPLKVARFLGWVTEKGDGRERMIATAAACSAAHNLIADKHLTRADLDGMSVAKAREFCTSTQQRLKAIDTQAKAQNATADEVKVAKANVAKGAKKVAEKVRAGEVADRNIRGEVDIETGRFAANRPTGEKPNPFLDVQIDRMVKQVQKVLNGDNIDTKVQDIKVLLAAGDVHLRDVDRASLEDLSDAFASVSRRAANAAKAVLPGKVVKMKEVK